MPARAAIGPVTGLTSGASGRVVTDPVQSHDERQAGQGHKPEGGDHDRAGQHCHHACGV